MKVVLKEGNMKFKKLLTVLGCFVLVLMCAFTFVGCGEVDATAEEVDAFLASDSVDVSMDEGIYFDVNVYGSVNGENVSVKMKGQIDKEGKGQFNLNFNAGEEKQNTTIYLDGNYAYFQDTKTKIALNEYTDAEGPESVGGYVKGIYDCIEDSSEALTELINMFGSNKNFKLQKKGDAEKGNITFIGSVNTEAYTNKATIRFDNFKITEVGLESKVSMAMDEYTMNLTMYETLKVYNGSVTLPSNLSEYETVSNIEY